VLDVSLSLDQVDAELADIRGRTILVVAGEVALLSALIIVLTRRFIGAPISRLMEATAAVSNMQLDHPIETRGGSELAELARSFDRMRERLRVTMAELGHLAQGLEAKVEERSAQLAVAREKLVQSDRLASLGQLAASVAHEINNPLAGVLNVARLMQRLLRDDGVPPERLEEFRRYLAQVASETTRASRIVADLLAFSRRSRPGNGPADVNAVVHATLAVVRHKLDLAGVAVNLDLAPALPAVGGDASQLEQVVMNLVINGAEAMGAGGTLSIRSFPVASGGAVALEVRDGGAGIPASVLPRIFDPFFTTKDAGAGVGLGLAVVYGIVKAHGGDIEVSSAVGAGTTFRVTLPTAAALGVTASPGQTGAMS
jgi:two-component system NtrC family sensor kinase